MAPFNKGFAHLDRRDVLAISAASTAALPDLATANPSAPSPSRSAREPIVTSLTINNQPYRLAMDVRTTLLDALREHLELTGTKKGCDHGQCGACTALVNGRRVLSCLTLAASVEGGKVTTIEGLAQEDGALHPMQQAFIDNDAFQCGYCTPGQIMSAIACVEEGTPKPTATFANI
jgi:xanthine dehydrogenase YagT iron-sulfur-binding subunit